MEFCISLEDGELAYSVIAEGYITTLGKGPKAKADALEHFSLGRQRSFAMAKRILSDQIDKADKLLKSGLQDGRLLIAYNALAADIPLDEPFERYRVDILRGETAIRSVEVDGPAWTYLSTAEIDDFGERQSQLWVSVSQLGQRVPIGISARALVTF